MFPKAERRNHIDIAPGMMFYFVTRDGGEPTGFPEDFNTSVPWIVVNKRMIERTDMRGRWDFLLLGPGPTLKWWTDDLYFIRRVADPMPNGKGG